MTTLDPLTSLPSYRPQQTAQVPPCQGACAVNGDVRGWVGIVAQRSKTGLSREEAFGRAWERLVTASPFPATLGRVCPHPCEAGCNRVTKDSPIAINALERFLGDWGIEHGLTPPLEASGPSGRSAAVVGAGPAGLSFAYQMARRGHHVVVYDRHPEPGGMLRYGIPNYRLPPATLDAEIDRIRALGVEIRSGVDVGSDITLDDLRADHDAVFIAAGAQLPVALGIPGEDADGVVSGVDYLGGVNVGTPTPLGDRVAVIGGGNTAVDAARSARRSGAHVELHYRRTRDEMPAIAAEIDDALAEGVVLHELHSPIEITTNAAGAVAGILMQRNRLGRPDASGRRRPEPIDGDVREVPVTAVVVAVSQRPELERLLATTPPRAETPVEIEPGLWVGGDATNPAIAGTAILHGRLVAEAVHADLIGEPRPHADFSTTIPASAIDFDLLPETARAAGTHVDLEAALADPELEVAIGIDEDAFLAEADRCFSCGLCHGCGRCAMYCTVGVYEAVENPGPGAYYTMNLTACTECGKCIEVCPCGYLTTTDALVHIGTH